jgi:hypothetical protein
MTGTDPLTERYAALGRVFDDCLVALERADADYLESPRAKRDLYAGALVGLKVIAEAIARARNAGLCAPSEGAMLPRADDLPAPLRVLAVELRDLMGGTASQVMTPASKTNGAQARSRREAWIRALIVEINSELREAGWSVAKASSEIAKVLKDAGKKDSTAKKVQNIIDQSRKSENSESLLVSEFRDLVRQRLSELNDQVFKKVETTTSVDSSPSPIIGYSHLNVSQ